MVQSKNLRSTLLVGLVCLNLLAAAWATFNLLESKRNYERAAEIGSSNLSLALDASVSDSVAQIDLVLSATVDFLEHELRSHHRIDPVEVNNFIQRQQLRIPEMLGIRATDANGMVIFGPDVDPAKKASYKDRDFFGPMRSGAVQGLFITDPVVGKVTGKWVVAFARVYTDARGEFAGVVTAPLEVEYFKQLMSKLDVGHQGIAVLRDRNLGLVARFPPFQGPAGQVGAKGASPELTEAIRSGAQTVTFHTLNAADGIERISTYRRLKRIPFHLSAGFAASDYLHTWYQEVHITLLEWLIFCAITTTAYVYLRQAFERIAQLADSKAQFLANMSHEIRTPMNGILGLLNLLQSTELSARQRDYASKAETSARSLLGVLNDVLDISKVEAGKLVLEAIPFQPQKMLRDLSVVVSANVGAKPLDVLFDIDPNLPDWLRGDALRLQQVLINLIGNAIKFTERGHVVLSIRVDQIEAEQAQLTFDVSDSGIGIAPDYLPHLFSMFSQAEGSVTRRFGGTGLGLAICQRFVKAMGGSLEVASALGRGSRFYFTIQLPVLNDAAVRAESESADGITALQALAQASELPAPNGPVLIVDDSEMAAAYTQQALYSIGWVSQIALSGAAALQTLEAALAANRNSGDFPFSAIYTDWRLPDMDGCELARQIRALAAQRHCAPPVVILVSAGARESLSNRSRHELASIDGFVSKPLTGEMLRVAYHDARQEPVSERDWTPSHHRGRPLAGMRILVVEDNLINQQIAEELLTQEGAVVSMAANGRLGVDAVAAAAPPYDVVLMDVQMPVMDGYSATREIRQTLGLHHLPIVAMTANAMAGDRDICLAAGMTEHVGKPFELPRLVALLLRLTGLHAAVETPSDWGEPAAAPTMGASPEPLPVRNRPGLELATALNRMAGLRGTYLRTAREFWRVLETLPFDLEQCLLGGDRGQLLLQLHTLKGNAASLGAMPLAERAAALEQQVKAGQPIAVQAAAWQGLIQAISDARLLLRQAINELTAAPVVQSAVPHALLEELAALAGAHDFALLERHAEMRKALEPCGEDFNQRLEHALQSLDWATVRQLCLDRAAQAPA